MGILGEATVQQAPPSFRDAIRMELSADYQKTEPALLEALNAACNDAQFIPACDWIEYRKNTGGGATNLMAFAEPGCSNNQPNQCWILGLSSIEEGFRLKDTALQEKGVGLLAQACESGVGDACYDRSDFGLQPLDSNQPPNLDEAKRFSTLGCELNTTLSCLRLGGLHQKADELEQAETVFRKACTLDSKQCGQLGGLLMDSDTTHKEGFAIVTKGCEDGEALSCTLAAVELAEKIDPDSVDEARLKEAWRLYQRGCELGNRFACRYGAMLANETRYLLILFAPTDSPSLVQRKLYDRGCSLDDSVSCFKAGTLLNSLALDAGACRLALDYLQRSCALDHAEGCAISGDILWGQSESPLCKKSLPTDPALSQRYLGAACELNDGRSCSNLSYILGLDPNVPGNLAESKRLLKRACMLDYKPACGKLSQQ